MAQENNQNQNAGRGMDENRQRGKATHQGGEGNESGSEGGKGAGGSQGQ